MTRDPGCKGDVDPNDPVCRVCYRSQANIDFLLEEIGDNLPFSVEIISCEKEQKRIAEEKSQIQNEGTYLDEEKQKLATIRLELEKKESLLRTKSAELNERRKNLSKQLDLISIERSKRIKYSSTDDPTKIDIEREVFLANQRNRVPGTKTAPPKEEVLDFTKMGRIVFHTEPIGMGIRKLDDNGTSPNIAPVTNTFPKFPQGCYYPIDVISQKDTGETLLLTAIINFDGTGRIDSTAKDKTEVVISVKKRTP